MTVGLSPGCACCGGAPPGGTDGSICVSAVCLPTDACATVPPTLAGLPGAVFAFERGGVERARCTSVSGVSIPNCCIVPFEFPALEGEELPEDGSQEWTIRMLAPPTGYRLDCPPTRTVTWRDGDDLAVTFAVVTPTYTACVRVEVECSCVAGGPQPTFAVVLDDGHSSAGCFVAWPPALGEPHVECCATLSTPPFGGPIAPTATVTTDADYLEVSAGGCRSPACEVCGGTCEGTSRVGCFCGWSRCYRATLKPDYVCCRGVMPRVLYVSDPNVPGVSGLPLTYTADCVWCGYTDATAPIALRNTLCFGSTFRFNPTPSVPVRVRYALQAVNETGCGGWRLYKAFGTRTNRNTCMGPGDNLNYLLADGTDTFCAHTVLPKASSACLAHDPNWCGSAPILMTFAAGVNLDPGGPDDANVTAWGTLQGATVTD